jgi:hypothetical protein
MRRLSIITDNIWCENFNLIYLWEFKYDAVSIYCRKKYFCSIMNKLFHFVTYITSLHKNPMYIFCKQHRHNSQDGKNEFTERKRIHSD